jgi:murein DD-endopeptidase MepM/ murein hydrolase activator NlpD
MPLEIRSRLPFPSLPRTRWLQVGACALLALAWFRAGDDPGSSGAPGAGAAGVAAQASTERVAQRTPRAAEDAAGRGGAGPNGLNEAGLGFSTVEVIVGRNDTLDRIFRKLSLSLADLASLRALPELRRQLDRLHVGEALKFSVRGEELVALERRLSPSATLKVVRAEGGFASDVIENPLEKEVRTATGTINSSLFQAAGSAGIEEATAMEIAEIFAWDIDFVLDIQRGDSFRVTYEALSQDGEYVGDGEVLAVEFVNAGQTYRAVRFTAPDGSASYYTPDGQSLRKAFIRAPVQFSRISSRFNMSRRHPVLNRIRAHKGVDYAAPVGTPVHAAGDGKVAFVGAKGGYGKVVEIAHAGGVTTRYGHLSRFPKGLARGARVRQSQVIGFVGMTGLATGPHLHYEYMVRGVHKDPQKVPLPKAEPVPASLMAQFRRSTTPLLATLDATGAAGALAASAGPGTPAGSALPAGGPGLAPASGVVAGR